MAQSCFTLFETCFCSTKVFLTAKLHESYLVDLLKISYLTVSLSNTKS